MKRIIKLVIKLILFTILGAASLYVSPIVIIVAMSHILLVWAKNVLKEYIDTFNVYNIVFKPDD